MEPIEIVNSNEDNGPYAIRTALGWAFNGPLREQPEEIHNANIMVNYISVDNSLDQQITQYFNSDYSETYIYGEETGMSVNDKRFMELAESSARLVDGHYEINLPLKDPEIKFPNNRSLAQQRLNSIKGKLNRDPEFKEKYTGFVENVIKNNYASEVSPEDYELSNGKVWYLPHHAVFHPRKHKICVVFDCSAQFNGTSLNKRLLQGPDLPNSLAGVLITFREEKIAMMADLEAMFHQVRVPCEDRHLLRFLWWKNGDTSKNPTEYHMNVHLFGATSSPAICNFALRKTARDNQQIFNSKTISTVNQSFYMDDCLSSIHSTESAVHLARELMDLCKLGGFCLTKRISNSRTVLASIPESERAADVIGINLIVEDLPTESALGVKWTVENLLIHCSSFVPICNIVDMKWILYQTIGFDIGYH